MINQFSFKENLTATLRAPACRNWHKPGTTEVYSQASTQYLLKDIWTRQHANPQSEPVSGYLVVDHHMYGAVCGVGRQVRQVERLVHDTLACERSITVEQNRHHL